MVSPDPGLWQRRDATPEAAADLTPPDGPTADRSPGDRGPDMDLPGVVTIYRSVGPGSTDPVVSGTGDLSISGVVATFSQALPGGVGTGDVLQYDTDGDGGVDDKDALAVVYRRYSASSYEVRTVDGAVPAAANNVGTWSVLRAYTSLADALDGTENSGIAAGLRDFDAWSGGKDLVAANQRWALACYADAKETGAVTISGWTTSAENDLRIFAPFRPDEVGSRQRHTGKAGTGFVIETGTTDHVVDIQSDHVKLEGLEITGWVNDVSNSSWEGVHVAADRVVLEGLVIHDDLHPNTTNPNADAINLNDMSAGQRVTIRNCAIYNISRGAVNDQGDRALDVHIESCSVHNTGTTLAQADGEGGINLASTSATVSVVNTICVGTGSGNDFKSGSGWGSSSNNISSDDSAPGAGSATQTLAADLFVSSAQGAEDLHLVAGATAVDKGLDLSGSFASDIDGEQRSAPWDIGADER